MVGTTVDTTELILVRHGQPVLKDAFLGRTDSPLTDDGWHQLRGAFEKIHHVDHLVSSTLARCAEFAKEVAEKRGWPLELLPGWQEYDFGEWDGLTFDELSKAYPGLIKRYFDDPANINPPQGESLLAFSTRVEGAVEDLLQRYRGKRVAVICHSGVIRTVVAWCLKLDYSSALHIHRLAIEYGSVTRIAVHFYNGNMTPQLLGLNHVYSDDY